MVITRKRGEKEGDESFNRGLSGCRLHSAQQLLIAGQAACIDAKEASLSPKLLRSDINTALANATL